MHKAAFAAVGIAFAGLAVAVPSALAQTAPDIYAKLDANAFAVMVRLTVLPEQRDSFLRAMKARIQDSRTHPAVVDFRILATSDPLVFQGYESFTSRAAFDEFAKTPQSQGFLAALKPILAKSIEVTLLNPLP